MLLKKIEYFNQYIDQFMLYTILLTSRQRQIIQIYLDSLTYAQMLEELENHYYISASTYKRELPEICLALSKVIDLENIPSLEVINNEFLKIYLNSQS